MSTVDKPRQSFAIASDADSRLKSISDELSSAILFYASQITSYRTPDGTSIIRTRDIETATRDLCFAVEKGMKSGDLPQKMDEFYLRLRELADTLEQRQLDDSSEA